MSQDKHTKFGAHSTSGDTSCKQMAYAKLGLDNVHADGYTSKAQQA